MTRRKRNLQGIAAGGLLLLLGLVLMICSSPFFPETQQEVDQIKKSEVIIDYSFSIHQYQDKMVKVALSIGQSLDILAESNQIFNFSIVNFTMTGNMPQLNQPDVVYLSYENTSTVNTTWSPQTRVSDVGEYYLVFLARDALPYSPVNIYSRVTKNWTALEFKWVPTGNRIPLLDDRFLYAGAIMAVVGVVLFSVNFSRLRRPSHRRT
jgi:hypothetical protein